ncbi:MAG: hypothetical protein ACFE85_01910 [Candidatus Hodarchaeota archaeon]
MDNLDEIISKIQEIDNPEMLNDYLILLSKNAKDIPSDLIDFILNDLDSNLLEKVKINFIYLLGEIGTISKLDEKFYEYLVNNYFESDRWVRDEILQAFIKISPNFAPNEKLLELLSFALNEDYLPIKEKALELLIFIETIPMNILIILMKNLNSTSSVILDKSIDIIKKNIKENNDLIDFLNYSKNYKFLNNRIIRSLLINYINSFDTLNSFKELILKSKWEEEYKNLIINEIEIYEKILLKRL